MGRVAGIKTNSFFLGWGLSVSWREAEAETETGKRWKRNERRSTQREREREREKESAEEKEESGGTQRGKWCSKKPAST